MLKLYIYLAKRRPFLSNKIGHQFGEWLEREDPRVEASWFHHCRDQLSSLCLYRYTLLTNFISIFHPLSHVLTSLPRLCYSDRTVGHIHWNALSFPENGFGIDNSRKCSSSLQMWNNRRSDHKLSCDALSSPTSHAEPYSSGHCCRPNCSLGERKRSSSL